MSGCLVDEAQSWSFAISTEVLLCTTIETSDPGMFVCIIHWVWLWLWVWVCLLLLHLLLSNFCVLSPLPLWVCTMVLRGPLVQPPWPVSPTVAPHKRGSMNQPNEPIFRLILQSLPKACHTPVQKEVNQSFDTCG
jgi:hypothetical protein